MKTIRWLSAVLAILAPAVHAAGVTVTPAAPFSVDTIVVEVTGVGSCSSIVPNAVEMVDARVIRVHFNDGANIQCFQANPPPKVTIGRLPAGTYALELVTHGRVPFVTTPVGSITVASSAGGSNDPPHDDYSGHYLTGVNGEGVLLAQSGGTAFISYLYLGADGKPTWVVMPDARWGLDSNGALRFSGAVWRVENQGVGQLAAQTGFGSFYPAGAFFDHARLQIQVPQNVERDLTRFRF